MYFRQTEQIMTCKKSQGGCCFKKKNRIQTGFRERSLKFHFFNVSVNANKDVKILWGNKYIQLDKNAILLKVRQKFLEI